MKKLFLLLFSLILSFNSYGEWTELIVDDEEVLYIDLETLQEKSDGYVYYWVMRTYRTWSTKSFMQTDCEFKRMNALQNDVSDGNLSSSVGDIGWYYVAPDTMAYRNLRVICEMVNESPEQREKSIENFQMSFEYKNKINDLYEKELENEAYKLLLEEEMKAEIQYKQLLAKEIQDEQDTARSLIIEDKLNTLQNAYINNIAARIKTFWRYQSAESHWTAEVYVVQDRDGNVRAVDVKNANVGNSKLAKSFMDSIERAVNKASPLPGAPDEAVFDKELYFIFSVN